MKQEVQGVLYTPLNPHVPHAHSLFYWQHPHKSGTLSSQLAWLIGSVILSKMTNNETNFTVR